MKAKELRLKILNQQPIHGSLCYKTWARNPELGPRSLGQRVFSCFSSSFQPHLLMFLLILLVLLLLIALLPFSSTASTIWFFFQTLQASGEKCWLEEPPNDCIENLGGVWIRNPTESYWTAEFKGLPILDVYDNQTIIFEG